METYEMRSMFTLNMEGLQLRLYQFSSLLQEMIPNLSDHLSKSGVHAAMYASQWFLTLFAYVFPMDLVTRIYDIIFAEGAAETIMRVAIAMLKRSSETILGFDEFEDILDFVTTKKLCGPYAENYSHVIRDAMALSDMITREKMDQLSSEYSTVMTSTTTAEAVAAGRFGAFWKKRMINNKPDMKRSVSTSHDNPVTQHVTTSTLPAPVLKKRWSSVSSRQDLAYRHAAYEEDAMQELIIQHKKMVNELVELRYDKQDLESERDALKLTILELERRRLDKRRFSADKEAKLIFLCDDDSNHGGGIDSPRSFSDLAIASKEEEHLMLMSSSRENSIHMLSSSSQSYTTTEFEEEEEERLSLSLTTHVAIFGDEEELSTQIVHLKVKNFELEQQIEKLNLDIEQITSKFDMVNEGQIALIDKLMVMKTEMDECLTEVQNKNKIVASVNEENQELRQEIERLKQSLSNCRIENGVLNQDLALLKSKKEDELTRLVRSNPIRMRRHSTTSSCMLTIVKNKRIHQLEQSLAATKVKLAEYESSASTNSKKKSTIYGRVLHAMKYNNN